METLTLTHVRIKDFKIKKKIKKIKKKNKVYVIIKYVNLENMYNSVNQYFPNEQLMMLQNHARIKPLFKVQDRPMVFNEAKYQIT